MNIDITKTYTTRSGLPVRIYATDGADMAVHGAYKTEVGWEYTGWTEDGSFYENGETNDLDLVPVKTWRAWKKGGNIPTWIIAKSKRDTTYVRAFYVTNCSPEELFEYYVWIHEDGTETPCGAEE